MVSAQIFNWKPNLLLKSLQKLTSKTGFSHNFLKPLFVEMERSSKLTGCMHALMARLLCKFDGPQYI